MKDKKESKGMSYNAKSIFESIKTSSEKIMIVDPKMEKFHCLKEFIYAVFYKRSF